MDRLAGGREERRPACITCTHTSRSGSFSPHPDSIDDDDDDNQLKNLPSFGGGAAGAAELAAGEAAGRAGAGDGAGGPLIGVSKAAPAQPRSLP